jgi:hypothetical protein
VFKVGSKYEKPHISCSGFGAKLTRKLQTEQIIIKIIMRNGFSEKNDSSKQNTKQKNRN